MNSFLVTGGCGFIGQHVVRQLLSDGARFVRVVDDLSLGKRSNLGEDAEIEDMLYTPTAPPIKPIQLIQADIRDEIIAEASCRDIDTVVHLAANTGVVPSVQDPRLDCLVNVVGTMNYLEAARKSGVRRFVFASSGATVGEADPPIHELLPTRPSSPYGASKLAGEAYCSAYARTFGITTVALRFGNVYGPRSEHKSSVVAKFIRHALAGQPLPIYGDGRQTRDFIYIDDLVRATLLACHAQGISGQVFQIATANETSIYDLAVELSAAFGAEGICSLPMEFQKPQVGEIQRNFADTTKARDRLGWVAQVSLHEGLRRTVRWAIESND